MIVQCGLIRRINKQIDFLLLKGEVIMVNYITIHNSAPCHCEPKYYIKGKEYTKEQYDSLI